MPADICKHIVAIRGHAHTCLSVVLAGMFQTVKVKKMHVFNVLADSGELIVDCSAAVI